jgi:hypothetical protein
VLEQALMQKVVAQRHFTHTHSLIRDSA